MIVKESSVNIVIAEPSYIIYEGLTNILSRRSTHQLNIIKAEGLADIQQIQQNTNIDIVLINPSLVQNQIKLFNAIKKELQSQPWVGIVYSFFDQQLISHFDALITVNDPPDKIIHSVHKLLDTVSQTEQGPTQETLSEREIEVLKLLVAGNSNKEIADKLFISTHTVITHRKNISQKTGIKSVSGLTIYAVVNNIITLDNFTE